MVVCCSKTTSSRMSSVSQSPCCLAGKMSDLRLSPTNSTYQTYTDYCVWRPLNKPSPKSSLYNCTLELRSSYDYDNNWPMGYLILWWHNDSPMGYIYSTIQHLMVCTPGCTIVLEQAAKVYWQLIDLRTVHPESENGVSHLVYAQLTRNLGKIFRQTNLTDCKTVFLISFWHEHKVRSFLIWAMLSLTCSQCDVTIYRSVELHSYCKWTT